MWFRLVPKTILTNRIFKSTSYYVCQPERPARLRLMVDCDAPQMTRHKIQYSIQLKAIDVIDQCLFAFDEIENEGLLAKHHRISVGGTLALELNTKTSEDHESCCRGVVEVKV